MHIYETLCKPALEAPKNTLAQREGNCNIATICYASSIHATTPKKQPKSHGPLQRTPKDHQKGPKRAQNLVFYYVFAMPPEELPEPLKGPLRPPRDPKNRPTRSG